MVMRLVWTRLACIGVNAPSLARRWQGSRTQRRTGATRLSAPEFPGRRDTGGIAVPKLLSSTILPSSCSLELHKGPISSQDAVAVALRVFGNCSSRLAQELRRASFTEPGDQGCANFQSLCGIARRRACFNVLPQLRIHFCNCGNFWRWGGHSNILFFGRGRGWERWHFFQRGQYCLEDAKSSISRRVKPSVLAGASHRPLQCLLHDHVWLRSRARCDCHRLGIKRRELAQLFHMRLVIPNVQLPYIGNATQLEQSSCSH